MCSTTSMVSSCVATVRPSIEMEQKRLLTFVPAVPPFCKSLKDAGLCSVTILSPDDESLKRICSAVSRSPIRESFSTNEILIRFFRNYSEKDGDRLFLKIEQLKDFEAIDQFFRNKFLLLFKAHVKKDQAQFLIQLCCDLILHSEHLFKRSCLRDLAKISKFFHFLFLCLNLFNLETETKEGIDTPKALSEIYVRILKTNMWVIYSHNLVSPELWQLNFVARMLKLPNAAKIFSEALSSWCATSRSRLPYLDINPRTSFVPPASGFNYSSPFVSNSLIILMIRLLGVLLEQNEKDDSPRVRIAGQKYDAAVVRRDVFPDFASFEGRSLIPLLPKIFERVLTNSHFYFIFDTKEHSQALLRVFSYFPGSTLTYPYGVLASSFIPKLKTTPYQQWQIYFEGGFYQFFTQLDPKGKMQFLDNLNRHAQTGVLLSLSIDCDSDDLERILLSMTAESRQNLIAWHLDGINDVLFLGETEGAVEIEIDDIERPYYTSRRFLMRARSIGNLTVSQAIANCLIDIANRKVEEGQIDAFDPPDLVSADPSVLAARLKDHNKKAIYMVLLFFEVAGLYSPGAHSDCFFNSFFFHPNVLNELNGYMITFLKGYRHTCEEERKAIHWTFDIVEQIFLTCPNASQFLIGIAEIRSNAAFLNAVFVHLVRNYFNLEREDQELLKKRLDEVFVRNLKLYKKEYEERMALLNNPAGYFQRLSPWEQFQFTVAMRFTPPSMAVKKVRKKIIEDIFFSILHRLREEERKGKVEMEGLLFHATQLQNYLNNIGAKTVQQLFKLILVPKREFDEKIAAEVRFVSHPLLATFIERYFVHTYMDYPDAFKMLVRYDSRLFTFLDLCERQHIDLDPELIREIVVQIVNFGFLEAQLPAFMERAEKDEFYFNIYKTILTCFGEKTLTQFELMAKSRPHLVRVCAALQEALKRESAKKFKAAPKRIPRRA